MKKSVVSVSLFAVLFTASACGRNPAAKPGFANIDEVFFPKGSEAPVKSDAAGIVTAAFDANAAETQVIKGLASSNLAQVAIAVAPGSLAVSTEISIREAAALNTELLVSNSAQVVSSGAAVSVTSSQPLDLKKPMVLALPIPASLNLNDTSLAANLGVIYKVSMQESGKRVVGFIPASELSIDSSNRVLYPTFHFGTFQVVKFNQQVAKTEVADTAPSNDGIQFVLAGSPVPACGAADVGKTIYTQATSQFQYCGVSGWEVVDLKGAKGDTGAKGEQGVAGADAPATPAIINVFDANGQNLGEYLGSVGINHYYVKLASSAVVRLTSDGTIGQPGTGSDVCQYESSDCSGTCLLDGTLPVANEFIRVKGKNIGGAGMHAMDARTVSFASMTYNTNSTWNPNSNSCTATTSTVTNPRAFTPYTLPYTSFALPLTLRSTH